MRRLLDLKRERMTLSCRFSSSRQHASSQCVHLPNKWALLINRHSKIARFTPGKFRQGLLRQLLHWRRKDCLVAAAVQEPRKIRPLQPDSTLRMRPRGCCHEAMQEQPAPMQRAVCSQTRAPGDASAVLERSRTMAGAAAAPATQQSEGEHEMGVTGGVAAATASRGETAVNTMEPADLRRGRPPAQQAAQRAAVPRSNQQWLRRGQIRQQHVWAASRMELRGKAGGTGA